MAVMPSDKGGQTTFLGFQVARRVYAAGTHALPMSNSRVRVGYAATHPTHGTRPLRASPCRGGGFFKLQTAPNPTCGQNHCVMTNRKQPIATLPPLVPFPRSKRSGWVPTQIHPYFAWGLGVALTTSADALSSSPNVGHKCPTCDT